MVRAKGIEFVEYRYGGEEYVDRVVTIPVTRVVTRYVTKHVTRVVEAGQEIRKTLVVRIHPVTQVITRIAPVTHVVTVPITQVVTSWVTYVSTKVVTVPSTTPSTASGASSGPGYVYEIEPRPVEGRKYVHSIVPVGVPSKPGVQPVTSERGGARVVRTAI